MSATSEVIITGAAGQDGLILGHKLIKAGHSVHAIVRDTEQLELVRVHNPEVSVEVIDSSDLEQIRRLLIAREPQRIFHLGAKSSVAQSWNESEETLSTNIFHTLNWLNALKETEMFSTRFYHASSSEMFGLPITFPQNEETLLHPRSPYGVSKVAAHHLVVNYRESYGQFAATGILFNHESPLRKLNFVTKKIAKTVAMISGKSSSRLTLGNLEISRDWGWAPDYVDGMIQILEHDSPEDFVLSTGVSHTLREFVSTAFNVVGISDWERYVSIDTSLLRPAEVTSVVGDSSKARTLLGWRPTVTFEEMVQKMVTYELKNLDKSPGDSIWKDF